MSIKLRPPKYSIILSLADLVPIKKWSSRVGLSLGLVRVNTNNSRAVPVMGG